MITLYTISIDLFDKSKALSDGKVVSKAKNEYGSAMYFL